MERDEHNLRIRSNMTDSKNQKDEKKVRWFFDGEEHVFSKKEEDFIKRVAPRFFRTDKI